MSAEEKPASAEKIARLKKVREERKEYLDKAMAAAKAGNAVRRKVIDAMKGGAGTVPEIAASSGVPLHEVLWHVNAMKKYDQAAEAGQEGGYYQYRLTDEAQS